MDTEHEMRMQGSRESSQDQTPSYDRGLQQIGFYDSSTYEHMLIKSLVYTINFSKLII